MKDIDLVEWIKIQSKLVKISQESICPKGVSFSLAGETHTLYTDGEKYYKRISGNGFCCYYILEEEEK